MMTDNGKSCPTCGSTLASGAESCGGCGQAFCPACFAPIDDDAAGCAACGAEFAVVCPQCDEEIAPDTDLCPHCGYVFDGAVQEAFSSRAALTVATLTQAGMSGELGEEEPDGICPACGEPVFLADGSCAACEALFCPECAGEIDESDESCPHCGLLLIFDCPLCGFELTAGSDLCPACGALFYLHCPACAAEVALLAEACDQCGTELVIEQRESSRVVQTLVVGDRLVRVFACGRCGTQFDSSRPDCPTCGQRVCQNCQLILVEGEEFCPRCRPDIAARLTAVHQLSAGGAADKQASCPACGAAVAAGDDLCAACGQLLCPACLQTVDEADLVCPHCGAEFELLCPNCQEAVEAADERCPRCGAAL